MTPTLDNGSLHDVLGVGFARGAPAFGASETVSERSIPRD